MKIKLPWLTILTCFQVKSQNPHKVTSSCDDTNLIVNIPHPDKNTANLLHLQAGNCDETKNEAVSRQQFRLSAPWARDSKMNYVYLSNHNYFIALFNY